MCVQTGDHTSRHHHCGAALLGESDWYIRPLSAGLHENAKRREECKYRTKKPVVAQNQHCHLLSVHGDDDGPAGVRDADDQHRLPLLHHLPQAHEAHQPQTHRQWNYRHQQGESKIDVVICSVVMLYY